jgi:hypothetical protein
MNQAVLIIPANDGRDRLTGRDIVACSVFAGDRPDMECFLNAAQVSPQNKSAAHG